MTGYMEIVLWRLEVRLYILSDTSAQVDFWVNPFNVLDFVPVQVNDFDCKNFLFNLIASMS